MVKNLRWLIAGASIVVGVVLVAYLSTTAGNVDRSQQPLEPRAEAADAHGSSTVAASDSSSVSATSDTRQITLTAGRNDFAPKRIVVNESDTVRLVLSSREVIHRFQLPDFGVNVTISPGTSWTVDVQADRQGIYRFLWSDLDGANSGQMAGIFIVQVRPN